MSFFRNKYQRIRVVPILLGSCALLALLAIAVLWYLSKTVLSSQLLHTDFVKNAVVKQIGEENSDIYDIMPIFLGFSEPQTYLIEFLNNTEIRPGGGFIGSYAVLTVDRGEITIVTLDGTENLDRNAPLALMPDALTPLKTHLGVAHWFFRDSNWSPDFAKSAEQGLSLYRLEGGISADDIDGVIGVTPTVLEHLLALVGPVTVQGKTFTAENVTETLEYEVEYAYEDRGIHVQDRKDILQPLFLEVMKRLKQNIITQYKTYLSTFETLADEKHILLYHTNPTVEETLKNRHWAGSVEATDGDYLLWVDANLGSLKTDYALDRTLSYEILGMQDGRYIARATMTYTHPAGFDWRTTRYITYARVFVPLGSVFQSVRGTLRSGDAITSSQVDRGQELGKEWFGTSFSIEPKQTKSLQFTYLLPEGISKQKAYQLLVQKQLGTAGGTLTLDLDFATLLQSALPPEGEAEWNNNTYRYTTDLSVDREFTVHF